MTTLHHFLDWTYGDDGDVELERRITAGADLAAREGEAGETPLHVATRRRRLGATRILLDHGAAVDARNAHGKTAYVHALRRGFAEIASLLVERGASTALEPADRFAVAVIDGRLEEAREILAAHPGVARTGNPAEDRLLADVAGREPIEPVELLLAAGADLHATALDGGTALHQAAWFGQPANARRLVAVGAPLDFVDACHQGTPLLWAVHGSRFSGDADQRQDAYVAIVELLLEATSVTTYSADAGLWRRLLEDASPRVREVLERAREKSIASPPRDA